METSNTPRSGSSSRILSSAAFPSEAVPTTSKEPRRRSQTAFRIDSRSSATKTCFGVILDSFLRCSDSLIRIGERIWAKSNDPVLDSVLHQIGVAFQL